MIAGSNPAPSAKSIDITRVCRDTRLLLPKVLPKLPDSYFYISGVPVKFSADSNVLRKFNT